MGKTVVRVSNLGVEINQRLLLENISFEVKEKEILAIIGPNGAGKTVLFKALLGLLPYSGKVEWAKGVKISYVPQKLLVEPDLPITTEEFFHLKRANKKEVDLALSSVGFERDKPHAGHLTEHVLRRKLGVLSGGELQRVLIAWALVGHPNVLLFDEPTAGVDVSTEVTVYGLLHKLQQERGLTILLISHELEVVYRYATNVLCLNKERVCLGTPREVLDKESLTKLFGGDISFYQHH